MTLDEYTSAVCTKLMAALGCSREEAERLSGDCDTFHSDMLTVDEAVGNIMVEAAQA
jgi:hypothetical protein